MVYAAGKIGRSGMGRPSRGTGQSAVRDGLLRHGHLHEFRRADYRMSTIYVI
jgi:hypothetical protein